MWFGGGGWFDGLCFVRVVRKEGRAYGRGGMGGGGRVCNGEGVCGGGKVRGEGGVWGGEGECGVGGVCCGRGGTGSGRGVWVYGSAFGGVNVLVVSVHEWGGRISSGRRGWG